MTGASVVTGAAQGLGRALAEAERARGRRVVGVDRIAGADILACDLSDRAAVLALPDALPARIDRLVHNAGISATGAFERIAAADHAAVLAVNAVAPILLTNALLDRIPRGGRIVFVSSLSHATGYPGAASYAASKDAVAVYARSVARTLRRRGICVTCVFPGPLRTQHAERHAPPGGRADRRADPGAVAAAILDASDRGRATLYPGVGAKAARLAGTLAPRATARVMGRMLFARMAPPDGGARDDGSGA